MKSLILALALVLLPAVAFGQQRHVRVQINTGIHTVRPHVHVIPHRNHYHYRYHRVVPRVVYPPIYVHPTPYTIPYYGPNYYPYGYYYRPYIGGSGIYLHVR